MQALHLSREVGKQPKGTQYVTNYQIQEKNSWIVGETIHRNR